MWSSKQPIVPAGTPSGYSSMATTSDPHTLAVAWEVMPLSKNDSRCLGPSGQVRGHVCQIGFATFRIPF